MAKWMVRCPDGATFDVEADEVKLNSGLNFYRAGKMVAHFPIEAAAVLGNLAGSVQRQPKAAPSD